MWSHTLGEKVIGLVAIHLTMQHHDLIVQLHLYRDSLTRIYKVDDYHANTKVKGIYGYVCSMNFSNNCKLTQTFCLGFLEVCERVLLTSNRQR